jgi:hypothetical protein
MVELLIVRRMTPGAGVKVLSEVAKRDPDPDQLAGDVVPLGQRVQRLARN